MTKISVITKKAFLLLTAVGSISFLAACGGNNPPAAENTTEEPVQEQAVETPDTTTAEVPAVDEADTAATPVANDAAVDTIVGVASQDDTFSTLVAALSAAELAEVLSGEGPFTVFAPTDEAFAALPEGTVEELLKPENKDKLVKLLQYHVVPTQVLSTEIASGAVETVQGEPINVQVDEATQMVMINDATVTQADILASNGVIHAIDAVILPPSEFEE